MKKKNTKLSIIFRSSLFILILLSMYIPLIGLGFGLDSPNYSKESLANYPSLPPASDFGTQFDNAWQDHFPFRSLLVTGNNWIMDKGFKSSGNERVIVGNEGWYFFEQTMRSYQHAPDMREADIARVAQSLQIQEAYVKSLNKDFQVFIIPNKNSIYPEHLPSRYEPVGEASELSRLMAKLPQFENMHNYLLDQKAASPAPIYHQEDSHWNGLGAYYAYLKIMERFGQSSKTISYTELQRSQNWEGDLTNMLYPAIPAQDEQVHFADYEQEFVFTRPLRTREDIEIQSRSMESGSLLLFRDSFANALMDYLSNSFGLVHYSTAQPYRYSLVESLDVEHVGVVLAERNINYLHQVSPEIYAPVADVVEVYETMDLSSTMQHIERNQMQFYNALYDDQDLGHTISQVRVETSDGMLEAFPIYQDENIQDDMWKYGFSFYTEEPVEIRNVFMYDDTRDAWYQSTSVPVLE